jgi:D-alanyl-D-alanine carboxypeptidase
MNLSKLKTSFGHGLIGLIALFLLVGVASGRWAMAGPYSALVAEVETDRVLYSQNPDEARHPASLTKMMTLYLLFEALARGELSLADNMRASAYAVSKAPSRLGLRAGETLTVEEGIYGLVTQSANDAAAAIAETLGGTETEFAAMMTRKARQLGMSGTFFQNASGLPNPDQVTTAWDMYRLGKALFKHFPQYYHYFSTGSFWFKGRNFHNHNHLLENYFGADGIKTGFVNASGFNLVASARRNGIRLIGVVFGGNTHARRDAHMRDLLDDGFAQLEGQPPRIQMAGFDPFNARGLLREPSYMMPVNAQPRLREKAIAENERRPASPPRRADADKTKPSWRVRVGEFPLERSAERRLAEALKTAPYAFRNAKGAVATRAHRGKKIYMAYFRGLSKEDASLACQFLKRKRLECSALPEAG